MMHLKAAQAVVFIQERIVFLLLLAKDKLGPSENKVVAAIFNRFALVYIYTGQASPSPGPSPCACGGLSFFCFFFSSLHFGLIYMVKEIFLL